MKVMNIDALGNVVDGFMVNMSTVEGKESFSICYKREVSWKKSLDRVLVQTIWLLRSKQIGNKLGLDLRRF